MKTALLATALLIAVIPAWASEAPTPALITCWYDQSGGLTGSTPAQPGTTPGTTTQTAAAGDRAWSRTVVGSDGRACPSRLPVSSAVRE
jgi:hypothetical protein